ncbi:MULTISPECIES: DUF2442 domain-containing protein [unclassified Aureimonas]|uniref:DUF2442 domain-containing protein n=1 Tax=unclassified Aureimonas TaxID=2615206 RepID=UPI000700E8C3|nr:MULTISPECIES: DUF2442 domain-containing protein [unclassified Aureimonas]KQT52624.1 hypothetical protein ASG62_15600 [Aureimonas sp. Leaf427]KQT77477.1 hypothetical protein ASG54_10810 [Aureimonas sp. Leaf460]
MTYRIQQAHALDNHRLRIVWTDGLTGTVDFERFMRTVPIYAALHDPAVFRDVRLYEYGHSIYWMGPDGCEIDICPDVLRAEIDPDVAAWIDTMASDQNRQSAAE